MHLVDVLEDCRQLRRHDGCVAAVYLNQVVVLERVRTSPMSLLCGLHTGMLISFWPNEGASARVSGVGV